MSVSDFLIIGSGLAGIAAAADLARAGATVTVLDKGRKVGGRAATRRIGGQPIDHGAQFCTARTERFQRLLEEGLALGWASIWCHGYPLWKDGSILHRPDGHPRWTFPDGMRTLAERIGASVTVQTETTVESVSRQDQRLWVARDTVGNQYCGRNVILNLPPPQLLAIAGESLPEWMAQRIRATDMAPCWAVAGLLVQDVDASWPALDLEGHSVLAWVARDHTRRRSGAAPAAVLHARGDWSQSHLDDPQEEVLDTLTDAAWELLGIQFTDDVRVHRWRYAKPEIAIGEPFLFDPDQAVGVCGDWCSGGRVEGAVVSGWELAATLLAVS